MVRVKSNSVIEISFIELKDKFLRISKLMSQGYTLTQFYVEGKDDNIKNRPLVIKLEKK